MKYFLAFFLVLLSSVPSYPQENNVTLKDNKIIVENDKGAMALDYSKEDKYVPYDLHKWDVDSEADEIKQALDVYKNKDKRPYYQKVWIVNKGNEKDKYYVEYVSKDKDDRVVFTNDENFAFYLGLSDDGLTYLYGINLLTNKASVVTQADNFNVVSCPNKNNYLVVQRDDEGNEKGTYVFNVKEDGFENVNYGGSFDNIEDKICY